MTHTHEAAAPIAERFWIAFRKTEETGYETWDESFATITDAREAAEQTVDDRDADEATLTARIGDIHETYRDGSWSDF